ncbi:ORC2 [Auxenochlorella protothecoides x Auxenochlorella symbiontica]
MPPRKRPKQAVKAPLQEAEATSSNDDEPLPFVIRGSSTGNERATFFGANAASGSSKTIANLNLEGLGDKTLHDVLAQLPVLHAQEKETLLARHKAVFPSMWQQWRAGHSLLFHGFGSKAGLLAEFAAKWTLDGACFNVNGLQPGLTSQHILAWATAAAKGSKPALYRAYKPADLMELLTSPGGKRVYVIINNIDGPGLRDPTSQRQLALLAAVPNVHLAASVDHVNAALLWDLQTRDRFAWVWHHVPTYAPYLQEVVHAAIAPLLVGRREEEAKKGALVVLASLSHNAREVFRLLSKQQLGPDGEQGIAFDRLFQLCREQFLVSNETLLSSFLTEFRDHDLLKARRTTEGFDLLHLPFAPDHLQQLLEDLVSLT